MKLPLSKYLNIWRSAWKLQVMLKQMRVFPPWHVFQHGVSPPSMKWWAKCLETWWLIFLPPKFHFVTYLQFVSKSYKNGSLSLVFSGWTALHILRLSYFLADRRRGYTIINLVCKALWITIFSTTTKWEKYIGFRKQLCFSSIAHQHSVSICMAPV